LNILLLSEGNPEKPFAFSGIGKNVLDNLRAAGHTVVSADVEPHGLKRLLVAGLVWSPTKRRWIAKYRGGTFSFGVRTRSARRSIDANASRVDAILQFGATFDPRNDQGIPYFLYCDSNKLLGRRSGHSPGATFTPEEYDAAVKREQAIYDGAAGIFVFSERVRRSFMEDFGVPPDKVRTVYAGANLDLTRVPATRVAPEPGHRPTILFVGRDFERKGGDLVLAAFANVRQEIPNARLVVIGPKELPAASEPGVDFLGFLAKDSEQDWQALLGAYASADVFCFPTRYEPFGIVLVESMFFQLPCVATEVWAIPEIVVDGETGYTVPLDDLGALTDRLLRVLRDPALARRMGAAGRARAEREFTWAAVTRKMVETMEGARGASRAGAWRTP
jgi:glycosyltransferase involved in cell wall biosynthesis